MASNDPRPSGELARLEPEIRTLAKPAAAPLIAGRGVVQRSPTIRAAFMQARADGWTPEQLAGDITPELERVLDCEPEAAVEVAQYLADEFFQLGDAIVLCDRTTGKALARITDEDFYQPPEQVREHSLGRADHETTRLARTLPRLNPNLEGFLVSYIFEEERDRAVRAELAVRLHTTPFLYQGDDPRLHAVTRAGRTAVAQDVRASLPEVLQRVSGGAGAFLQRFATGAPWEGHGFDVLPRRTAEARGSQGIVDSKAMNHRFSWEATIKARTGAAWVREIAAHLINEASARIRPDLKLNVSYPLLAAEHVQGRVLWAGEPSTLMAIQRLWSPDYVGSWPSHMLPCEGTTSVVGFTGGLAGALVIHDGTYEFTTRERHGRWEMIARMEYTLYVDWDNVRFLTVTDIPVEGFAEIL